MYMEVALFFLNKCIQISFKEVSKITHFNCTTQRFLTYSEINQIMANKFHFKTFSLSQKGKPTASGQSFFLSFQHPILKPYATSNLLFDFDYWQILDHLYKWNHTSSSLWCLTSVTENNIPKVHLQCGMCECCFLFYS